MTSAHGRPTAAELIAAVAEFLETDVRESTAGQINFHSRVAANALRIVERELLADADDGVDDALAGVGCVDEAQLAAAIRARVSCQPGSTYKCLRNTPSASTTIPATLGPMACCAVPPPAGVAPPPAPAPAPAPAPGAPAAPANVIDGIPNKATPAANSRMLRHPTRRHSIATPSSPKITVRNAPTAAASVPRVGA